MKDKQSILNHILTALDDRSACFVFPSAVPAEFWARETALATGKPLAPDRFIAWDTFKERALSSKRSGKQEINRAVRTLFASSLLRENHREFQKGKALLRDYINPDYAGSSYSSFIGSIARLLPALDGILRRPESAATGDDPYFNDLRLIHDRYAAFLDEHQLYEPSWNRAAFSAFDEKWLLFFPELAEDWDEYEEELSLLAKNAGDTVRVIPLSAIDAPACRGINEQAVRAILEPYARKFLHFRYSADEYRAIALTIRRLLDEAGLGYEDIVISFPGSGNQERLIQEFRLHDIPVNPRRGRSLVEYPAGRIFTALSACPSQKWSFRALKALLLDKAFPWKDKEWIDILIDFGLRYRCLSGFRDGNRDIDVWEKTFEQHIKQDFPAKGQQVPVYRIEKFYEALKRDVVALVNATTFENLRIAWRRFSENHFDEDAFHPDTDKIIGRAMRALEALINIEKQFPGLSTGTADSEEPGEKSGRAFPIFLSYIQEEQYVYQSDARGILLYDYKVAAGIGPTAHFLINMNQEDVSIVYAAGSSFLREDRKRLLKISDRDVSAALIRAYTLSGCFPVFSVSDQTFSGSVLPHRRLQELAGELSFPKDIAIPLDPYTVEAELAEAGAEGIALRKVSDTVSLSANTAAPSAPTKVSDTIPSGENNATPPVLKKVSDTTSSGANGATHPALGKVSDTASLSTNGAAPSATIKVSDTVSSGENGATLPALKKVSDTIPSDANAPAPPTPAKVSDTAPSEIQKRGYHARETLLATPRGVDLSVSAMKDIALREALRERLGKQILFSRIKRYLPVDDENTQALNDLRISPTDLNEYQVCPFKWVLERGLIIEPKQTEIETIDQRNVGTLYHNILESLFKRIKEEGDGCFHAEEVAGEYQTYIIEETRKAIGKAQLNEGAFQEAVYDMLRPRIAAAISDYLLIAELDGATILGAEVPLRREYPDSETALSGKSDLVLRDSDGDLIVIDFKTAALPGLSELVAPDEIADAIPEDVQIAAYINMLENGEEKDLQYSDKAQVRTARFYSIDNRKFRDVVGEGGGKGKYRMPRSAEEYQREASAVDALFTQVTDTVKQGAYHAARDRHNCGTCTVSSVCRRPFIA